MISRNLLVGLAATLLVQCLPTGAFKCGDILKDGQREVSKSTLSAAGNDVQQIVDCVPAGAELVFEASLDVQLKTPVTLKQPIVLKGQDSGKKKPVFSCAKENISAFKILSHGIGFENLIIQECSLNLNTTASVEVYAPAEVDNSPIYFQDVHFLRNSNERGGGAIYIGSAENVKFRGVLFNGNSGKDGGAVSIDSHGVNVEFTECRFEYNWAYNLGGALHQNSSAYLTVMDSVFVHNRAESSAGAVHIRGEPPESQATFLRTDFFNNSIVPFRRGRPSFGGGMLVRGPKLEIDIEKCTFRENFALHRAGGILFIGSRRPGKVTARIDDSSFEGNGALWGGAIHAQSLLRNMTLTIVGSEFRKNLGTLLYRDAPQFADALQFQNLDPGQGGALRVIGPRVSVNIENASFENNQAQSLGGPGQRGPIGGAIATIDAGAVTIKDSTFKNNSAAAEGDEGTEGSGGAIHARAAGIRVSRVLGAPLGSECSSSCNSGRTGELGFLEVVDGCGQSDTFTERVCVLSKPEECQPFPIQRFIVPDEDDKLAKCELVTLSSSFKLSGVTFIGNVVDRGNGGAVEAAGRALDLQLDGKTKFIRNKALGGNGGAIFVGSRAQVTDAGALFQRNKATDGKAVSIEVNTEGCEANGVVVRNSNG